MTAARKLSIIPCVENFEVLAQTSDKNDYTFGLSMEFSDQAAYQAHCDHPDHGAFIGTASRRLCGNRLCSNRVKQDLYVLGSVFERSGLTRRTLA
jgi:hypothetical protein